MPKKEKIKQKVEKAHLYGLDEEYQPYFERVPKEIQTTLLGITQQTLYDVIKRSPEVVAAMKAIIEDVMADGWRFEGSASAVKKAEKFILQSGFYKVLSNAILDLLITGNAYILKLSVNERELKSLVKRVTKRIAKVMKIDHETEKEIQQMIIKQTNAFIPKDLQLLKSKTMEIAYDETGEVKYYYQKVGDLERIYNPEDIIHISVMNVGGTVYGFSPLESLLSDLGTLIFAKEYAGKFFENDGMPHLIINLPEASGTEDRNYQVLKQELKELKRKENKFRGLITTGPTNVTTIDRMNKDLQFKELIRHFTQIILMAFGVPPHRIDWTVEVRQGAEAVNKAFESYFKNIAHLQNILEYYLNKQLWTYFNVVMRFKRGYRIDELREANIVAILLDRDAITIEEARKMMGMEEKKPKSEYDVKPSRSPKQMFPNEMNNNQISNRTDHDLNRLQNNQLK